jgi:hypothetical protein
MRNRLLMLIAIAVFVAAGSAEAAGPTGQSTAPVEAASSASASPGTSASLPEVTVLAQRLKLEAQVSSFVNGITALQNNEGLARWHTPVCPLVSGLPAEEGEFILGRVSEIARAAGVPLAGEKCRANLFIFVTTHPKELAQAMEQGRYRVVVFADAAPLEVDEFVNTPLPVRVWHSTYETSAEGIRPTASPAPGVQVTGGNAGLPFPEYYGPGTVGASRLVNRVKWEFSSAYVVADQTQLHGVSRGQFADYVAMVTLAEIKPSVHLGDTQSILKLFAGAPGAAAPAGMSAWDQAFLKSLYGTQQESKLQRSLITHSMVRELVGP